MSTLWLIAMALLPILLTVVVVLASWLDLRERRIPNWVTGGGLLGGLAIRAALGPTAVWSGFLGAGLGLTLGILFFAIGAMGAGDGKLLAALGALLGLEAFLWSLPLIAVFGGLLAIVMTARGGMLFPSLLSAKDFLFYLVSFGRVGEKPGPASTAVVTVPYGVAAAAGAYVAWLGWGLSL